MLSRVSRHLQSVCPKPRANFRSPSLISTRGIPCNRQAPCDSQFTMLSPSLCTAETGPFKSSDRLQLAHDVSLLTSKVAK
jgi:hypothetical protein